jgi:hypothetical protein
MFNLFSACFEFISDSLWLVIQDNYCFTPIFPIGCGYILCAVISVPVVLIVNVVLLRWSDMLIILKIVLMPFRTYLILILVLNCHVPIYRYKHCNKV